MILRPDLPDFTQFIYDETNLSTAIENHVSAILRKQSLSKKDRDLADKLMEFQKLVDNQNNIQSSLISIFNRIIHNILVDFPNVFLQGRIKGYYQVYEKCLYTQSRGNSLDTVTDFIGGRIILNNNNIHDCYVLAKRLISFLSALNCKLVKAQPLKDISDYVTQPNIYDNSDITAKIDLPSSDDTIILDSFKSYIKDYVSHPKSNGYQSIHFVVDIPEIGTAEFQIRTLDMHNRAEINHTIGHNFYKQCKYGSNDIKIEPDKVLIDGFKYNPEKDIICDNAGVITGKIFYHYANDKN